MLRSFLFSVGFALAAGSAQAGDLYVSGGAGFANGFTIDDNDVDFLGRDRNFEADFEGGLVATGAIGWRKTTHRGSGLRIELLGTLLLEDFELDEITLNGVGATAVDRTTDAGIQQFDATLEANDPFLFGGEASGFDVAVMGYYDWQVTHGLRPYFGVGFGYGLYEIEASALFFDGDGDTVTDNCTVGAQTNCLAGVALSQEIDTFVVKAAIGVEKTLTARAAVFAEARYEAVVGGNTDGTTFVNGTFAQPDVDLKIAQPSAYVGVRLFF